MKCRRNEKTKYNKIWMQIGLIYLMNLLCLKGDFEQPMIIQGYKMLVFEYCLSFDVITRNYEVSTFGFYSKLNILIESS